jgi:nucleotide-binding universal stress UspA family protein
MGTTSDEQTTTIRPWTAVVGLDFSDADVPALDQAIRLARRAMRGEVHLIHVFEKEPSPEEVRDLAAHLHLYVNEKAASLGGLPGVRVGIHLRAGHVAREIARLAVEIGADLVVLGSRRGLQIKHWIVGSTAQRLREAAPCPVLVANPWPKEPADAHLIVIDAPCPDCVRARAASAGSQWWCERHTHQANGAHTYSYQYEVPFTTHDSVTSSTGVDF